jgi:enamine deaminase RidA (YjgF/YER057c/UK114 family)
MRIVMCLSLAALSPVLALTPPSSDGRASGATHSHRAGVRRYNPAGMAQPLSTYSQVAEITGSSPGMKLVFIAGQVGQDASGQLVSTTDFGAQVEQAFTNVKVAVQAAGGTMSDLVKTNYYCTEAVDPSQMSAFREIRDRYISKDSPPTSTFFVVKRLARPEFLIEIEAVAAIKN